MGMRHAKSMEQYDIEKSAIAFRDALSEAVETKKREQ